MNFETQTKSPGKRPGGMTLLILIAVVAFVLINNMQQGPDGARPDAGPVDTTGDWSESSIDDVQTDRRRSDSGDWQMEEVETVNNKAADATVNSKRTNQGDWSLEEVETGSKQQTRFEVASPENESKEPKSKSTRKGDWEIEEVDKKNN